MEKGKGKFVSVRKLRVIMAVGVRKICDFSPTLTEAQLYLSAGVLLVSVFQCVIISMLFDKKRKAA